MAATVRRVCVCSFSKRYAVHRGIAVRNIRTSTSLMTANKAFDEKLLEILVCPLSKKPLRYDKDKNELISDELGVAYPILPNGTPNLIPQEGRILAHDKKDTEKAESDDKS